MDAEPTAKRRAQLITQAARVAAAIQSRLRAVQVEPDESTAAFLARYGVERR